MRILVAVLVVVLAGCASGAPTDLPAPEDLTEQWDCGFGFWVSDEAQTTSLRFSYQGEGSPDPTVDLPHPDWEASLLVGNDLHANWCDDVSEPGEPVAQVGERLPVVAGTLAFVGGVPEDHGGGGGHSATAEVSGVEVELADGTPLDLGSFTLVNSHWGLLAG